MMIQRPVSGCDLAFGDFVAVKNVLAAVGLWRINKSKTHVSFELDWLIFSVIKALNVRRTFNRFGFVFVEEQEKQ